MLIQNATSPLQGMQVVTLAVNVPGPVAAARLRHFGAAVVKIEPPDGDPLARISPAWYASLIAGQEVLRLNLKTAAGRARLDDLLARSDLLLTSSRPAALARLGLAWPDLHARHPHLCQVAVVGYAPPQEHVPGHDLTYQAGLGMLAPPGLPRTLLADLAGAEQAVSAALALLLGRARGHGSGYLQVALAQAAEAFAAPLHHGLTAPGGVLGGGLPGYNLYRARDGWIAVAALEPHFQERLERELGLHGASRDDLARAFQSRTAEEWETWASARDLPIAAVCDSVGRG